ncbi:PH domain-containing protein [Streptomyces sp. NPDC059708]|uniref:PH domain-containing protein n=1 Tax=Streptomyces sp. NPDC059708 TaxID=3346916 RepID=UPI0036B5E999
MGWVSLPLAVFLLKIWTEPLPYGVQVSATTLSVAAIAWTVVAGPRQFATVDEEGISVRVMHRVRRFGWSDIYDIRPGVGLETDQIMYVHLTNGRHVPLPFADRSELGEAGFQREIAALQAIIAAHRAPGWAPDPWVESRIARRAARLRKSEGVVDWMGSWKSYAWIFGLAATVLLVVILLSSLT